MTEVGDGKNLVREGSEACLGATGTCEIMEELASCKTVDMSKRSGRIMRKFFLE